jgi:hypothetical protein
MTFLLGRFDHIAGFCESKAYRVSRHGQGDSLRSRHWLLCLDSVMQQGLFCRSQHEIVSYDNDFAVKRHRGFNRKQRS